jgi:DNA polymerase
MSTLYLDLETYSEIPITYGTHVYATGAEVLLFAYAVDNEPAKVWDVTAEPQPNDLTAGLFCDTFVMHNSHFDATILRQVLGIDIPTNQIHDTMVQALSHSLPGSLGMLCDILGLPTDKAKDKDGKKLINLFCKPLGKNRILRRATALTHSAEWERFKEYARLDVEAMREIKQKMPAINMLKFEHELWELDQKINNRGVAIDMQLVKGAIKAIDQAQAELKEQTMEMTFNTVDSANQTEALRLHIFESYGIDMPNLQSSTVEKMLNGDLPEDLKELLRIRLQASTTSTSKYKTLLHATSPDGRLRGTLQFNGASRTGRWAGRLFQPQNLPRPTLPQSEIDEGIEAIKAGCAHIITGNVMELTSSAVRSTIVAPKGKKLVVADLSNIEGRVQAWLANEEWKLKAFSEFDEGVGPDLYKLAYSKSFKVPAGQVTKDQRQIGKVMELALAYEGGVGAFSTFATAYGINLDDLAEKILDTAPKVLVQEAKTFLEWSKNKNKTSTHSLSDEAFVACDVLKRAWRIAHPQISGYWLWLKNTVIFALNNRGQIYRDRGLVIRASKGWLIIQMPSGRSLCYPAPQIVDGAITYKGINQYTRQWERIRTHGGKLFENLCQAVARDVMAANMPNIEADGYEIVLTVHDEIIAEAPDDPQWSASGLAGRMSNPPRWARDMPLAAAGFETYRYKKD